MESAEDDRLLEAIVRDRDRDAFMRLYERHERAAYNLARYLLRNADDAEDAVQEGFAQVWASADTYRAGNARSWILRIVARKCFRLLRRTRPTESETVGTATGPVASDEAPERQAERGELNSALRLGLDGLSSNDRQIIALHYGAGLSQDDVASTLAMPQTTVSYRLKSILSHLRTDLTRAGFAGVSAKVTSEAIGDAVCVGHSAPAGLAARVTETAFMTEAAAMSGRAAAAVSSRAHMLPWFLGAAVVVGGVSVWVASERDSAPQHNEATRTPESETPEPKVKKRAPVLPVKWNFEKGPPAGLVPVFGAWTWEKGRDGKAPGMRVTKQVWLPFPSGLKPEPMAVVVRGRLLKSETMFQVGTYCVVGRRVQARKEYHAETHVSHSREFVNSFYIWGRRHATVWDRPLPGKADRRMRSVAEYVQAHPTDTLHLAMEGMVVTSIEFHVTTLERIPAQARAEDLSKSGLFTKRGLWYGYELGEKTEHGEPIP